MSATRVLSLVLSLAMSHGIVLYFAWIFWLCSDSGLWGCGGGWGTKAFTSIQESDCTETPAILMFPPVAQDELFLPSEQKYLILASLICWFSFAFPSAKSENYPVVLST